MGKSFNDFINRGDDVDEDARDCGQRNTGLAPRISDEEGREEAAFGEWPNMCIILKRFELNGKEEWYYWSGASLIAPDIVLTAAHKVEYASKVS